MAAIDLCNIADVKEAMDTLDNDTSYDTKIPDYITRASRIIMNEYKREFRTEIGTGSPPNGVGTRRFKVDGYRVDFSPWDVQSVSQVSLHPETTQPLILASGAGTANAQYILKPINPQRGVYQSLQFSGFLVIVSQTLMAFNFALVDVTGTWGFPSVPEDVTRACAITVASWLTRSAPGASAPWGIPGHAAQGAISRGNDWHIPWAAKKILGEYKRGSSRWAF